MGGAGKKKSSTSSRAFLAHDNDAYKSDDAHSQNGTVVDSPRIKNFGKFTYPIVCSYCKSLWDNKGSTDLISPCGCDGTSLHVHETCLTSWLRSSGKVRCEACKAVYSNSNLKELQAELTVQKINFCLIAIFMPVGVIVIVGACLLIDFVVAARAKAVAAGVPIEGLGVPPVRFVIWCIIFSCLTLFAVWKAISIMRGRKLKTLENLTVITA